jgi:hypothetical protein
MSPLAFEFSVRDVSAGLSAVSCLASMSVMDSAAPNQQQILDNEHLKLLSIFHYVKGGITAFFACIPIIHVGLGMVMIFGPHLFGHGKDQPPAFVGWLFVILGSVIILLGWTFAALLLIAGKCISRRKHYMFCFVMACVECLSAPFGAVLGGCTILVLNRPSVKELFNRGTTAFKY